MNPNEGGSGLTRLKRRDADCYKFLRPRGRQRRSPFTFPANPVASPSLQILLLLCLLGASAAVEVPVVLSHLLAR